MVRQQKTVPKRLTGMIPRRMTLLFFVIVCLFSLLVLRLAQMQLVQQSFYLKKLKDSTTYTIKTSSPRGQIYDAKGVSLAENDLKTVVAYTRSNRETANDIKKLAQKLSAYVHLAEGQVTDRAKRDYYLADPAVYQEVYHQLPREEKVDRFGNPLAESAIYANAVAAVPDEAIAYGEEELRQIYLFHQMNSASAFSTVLLRTELLTPEQIAKISVDLADSPSISLATDWERRVPDSTLSSIIGKISSQEAGLPKEEAQAYLEKGYSLNDRVGNSFLEKQYEEVLQGQREVRTIRLNKEGQVTSDRITTAGKMGNNLKLTLDLDFQKGVEAILTRYFQEELAKGHTRHSEGVYAVALDPNTGAVLAMAGLAQDLETGELASNALGTMTQVFTPGSVIKGATLASAWENGILSGNASLLDQPIQLAGSQPINSWFTGYGSLPVTATQALEYSSNTYMVQLAIRLMGQEYASGMILKTDHYQKAMERLRATYAAFGLGVSTGIDLPSESYGFVPKQYSPANVLTASFGQFDNYTTMQLAQYVATIANGGRRLAPHVVEGIYATASDGGLGEVIETLATTELNHIALSARELELIQEGFYQVVHSSSPYATGRMMASGAAVPISAKTGTAEAYVTDKDGNQVYTSNLNVVAYAPSHNPQIAVAVVLPHSTDLLGTTSQAITRDIINLYHSLSPMQ